MTQRKLRSLTRKPICDQQSLRIGFWSWAKQSMLVANFAQQVECSQASRESTPREKATCHATTASPPAYAMEINALTFARGGIDRIEDLLHQFPRRRFPIAHGKISKLPKVIVLGDLFPISEQLGPLDQTNHEVNSGCDQRRNPIRRFRKGRRALAARTG